MRALLDVNVLIALLDSEHIHHAQARGWLRDNVDAGWATCPITENGCVRIMAQPAYPNPLPAAMVAERLRAATATRYHRFWADDVSLLSPGITDWSRAIGPRQLTDVYLLALAARRGGRFVTFDARIALTAVPAADAKSLCVI